MTGCGGVGATIASLRYSEPTTFATWVQSNAVIHMYREVGAAMGLGLPDVSFIIWGSVGAKIYCTEIIVGVASALRAYTIAAVASWIKPGLDVCSMLQEQCQASRCDDSLKNAPLSSEQCPHLTRSSGCDLQMILRQ